MTEEQKAHQALVEKVAREIYAVQWDGFDTSWDDHDRERLGSREDCLKIARAVIAMVTEECARVAKEFEDQHCLRSEKWIVQRIHAAIRALGA